MRRQLNNFRQCSLNISTKRSSNHHTAHVGFVEFHDPSVHRLCIGDLPLKDYLVSNKMGSVLTLRDFLSGLDWAPFAASYTGRGRKPAHPKLFLGLIIYGMLEGKWSLRELERLAIRDLGAWWICGGVQPDHSTIGNFINLHADILSEEFFVSLTRQIFKKLNLDRGDVAGDGTVIEAAGSRLKTLKAEAAQAKASENQQHSGEQTRVEQAADVAKRRDEAIKRKRGKNSASAKVCITEPDAVVQKQKNGRLFRPSYKPSVLADEHRIILGQAVDPSDENIVVDQMLGQYEQVAGGMPKRMMFDGGYFNFAMLERSIELDIDLLCPSGGGGKKFQKRSRKGRYLKGDFVYDDSVGQYICPANRRLRHVRTGREKGLAYKLYRCLACSNCSDRKKCTDSKLGRTVKRYEKEDSKEAMSEVMSHPGARAAYRKRQAMVEPVYSQMRGRQGLNRFRRFGTKKVRLEFSLHCIAYNVGRLLRLGRAFGIFYAEYELNYQDNRLILQLRIKMIMFC